MWTRIYEQKTEKTENCEYVNLAQALLKVKVKVISME